MAPSYPTHNIKQKEFTRPRPAREYTRFLPTKKALSGMDAHGTISEFIKNSSMDINIFKHQVNYKFLLYLNNLKKDLNKHKKVRHIFIKYNYRMMIE